MTVHTVTQLGKTQKGSPVVYFDNRHTRQDMVLCGNTVVPPLGAVIETEMASKHLDNGVELWFLNEWKYAPTTGQPKALVSPVSKPLPMNNGTAPIGASPPMSAPSGYTEPERMFISNLVAAAITSGKCGDPADIPAWVNAALYAIRNAKADLWQPDAPEAGPVPF